MSLVDNGNGLSAADVAAVMGSNNNGLNGEGWWLLIILFAIFGGWGNGANGGMNNNALPWLLSSGNNTNNDVQRGFDQTAVMSGLGEIQGALNANQIAAMQQGFAQQTALSAQLNAMAANQASCCCENRLGLANLGADIAREACADRTAVSEALRDIIASNTANTQAILDKMCQQELDALKTQNIALQNQLNMAAFRESQVAQNGFFQNALNNAVQQIRPTPDPAYIVPNPYAGYNMSYGCGCNCGSMA